MNKLLKILNNTKDTLDKYYTIHKNENYSNVKNSPKDYLEWINKKTTILINSSSFVEIPKNKFYEKNLIFI